MNYSEMTDFEINCAVARALGISHAFFFSKSEGDFCEGIEPNERGPIWQSKEYEVGGFSVSNGNCFNPCNSWSAAGPIIRRHKISLIWVKTEIPNRWDAGSPCHMKWSTHECNPLRAAMETFLMMQEQPDAA